MPRYAIYFAPERDTRLWQFGCRVLGYDAETREPVPQFVPEGIAPDDWKRFTASPRRYGFHATLKAPFQLAEDRSESELFAAFDALGHSSAVIGSPSAVPVLYGDYAALLLSAPDAGVQALADACVSELDPFRAPLSEAERDRRLSADMIGTHRHNLEKWGYPYVFSDFTFHMTLAGPLPSAHAGLALNALTSLHQTEVGGEELAIRSIALFVEPAPGEPFFLVRRAKLQEEK